MLPEDLIDYLIYRTIRKALDINSMNHRSLAIEVGFIRRREILMSESNQIPNDELQALLDYPGPVIINCWADWCIQCHMISPLIDQLSEAYKDHIKLVRIDIDEKPGVASELGLLGVNSIPVTFVFKKGELAEKITGIVPYEKFEEAVEKQLA
jgi:thioredoxin 1